MFTSLPTILNRSAIASTRSSIRFLSFNSKPAATTSATNFFIPRVQAKSSAILTAAKQQQQRHNSNSSHGSSSNIFKLFFASAGASFLLTTSFAKSIYNDAGYATPRQQVASNVSVQKVPTTTPAKSRFGGNLNYEELTIGSVTGLFLGIILGKLSQVFVFISLSSFLLVEFLQSRNIINVPWNYIFTVGKQKIDLKQLVFEKPSFKISFVLSLIIAAYNV